MTKKALCIILTVISVFLSGCTSPEGYKNDGGTTVVTTVFPAYDFARGVFGDRADITLLLPPGAESHSWEPSPKDIIKIQNADLFIYNGGESDAHIEAVLSSLDKKPATLKMTDCSKMLTEDSHNHGDEHVWMDVKNAISIVDAICVQAVAIDEKSRAYFEENTKSCLKELEGLDKKLESLSKEGGKNTLVFADKFPARYFTEGYGFESMSAFEGCADEAEPSGAKIAEIIDYVKEESIPVVFYIEFSNMKIADTVTKETGCEKRLFHSCHNVSAKELKEGITYIDLMENNYQTVLEAIKK